MTTYWSFLNYIDAKDVNLIKEWYLSQEPVVMTLFDNVIKLLSAVQTWDNPKYAKELTKEHAGLTEIKFRLDEWKYRPVGFVVKEPLVVHGQAHLKRVIPGEFALILGCRKSGRICQPEWAFERALELKTDYLTKKYGKLALHDF